jgi:N-dimethylarginine dimethylaminohydrolase
MEINSNNEWDPLRTVILGDATNANWPVNCSDFRELEETTAWKETPVPAGPVSMQIIDEANHDLQQFSALLTSLGVTVLRPSVLDFQSRDGMYNYCPRDRFLVVGDKVISAPMAFKCRYMEEEAYPWFDDIAIKPDDPTVVFDAANVCRLGNDLLYLVSNSGNYAGAKWLQRVLGSKYKVHIVDNIYSGVHIDSTVSPVRDGLVVLNAARVNIANLPEPLRAWDKIWVEDDQIVPQEFTGYPYASKWIGLNFLTVDPDTVVCDPKQVVLRDQLAKFNVVTHGIELRHSRTLGGGHHCVTLDVLRR